jgi:hypothetical protein
MKSITIKYTKGDVVSFYPFNDKNFSPIKGRIETVKIIWDYNKKPTITYNVELLDQVPNDVWVVAENSIIKKEN